MAMTAHEELLEIHRVIMCIADAEPPADTDPYTLREVKRLSLEVRRLRQMVNQEERAPC